jgi:hypothetical protein
MSGTALEKRGRGTAPNNELEEGNNRMDIYHMISRI